MARAGSTSGCAGTDEATTAAPPKPALHTHNAGRRGGVPESVLRGCVVLVGVDEPHERLPHRLAAGRAVVLTPMVEAVDDVEIEQVTEAQKKLEQLSMNYGVDSIYNTCDTIEGLEGDLA